MNHKKNRLSFLFLIAACVLQAQVQNVPPMRQVLSTTGGTYTFPSGIIIDYTVGDFMVKTYTSSFPASAKNLTEGFQQPDRGIDSIRTINDSTLKFYSGITPNSDGENDVWEIDGIAAFPNNKVSIFNRWGDKIWSGENYDNIKVVWDGKTNGGQALPDATYFYIVETDDTAFKGWVELTK